MVQQTHLNAAASCFTTLHSPHWFPASISSKLEFLIDRLALSVSAILGLSGSPQLGPPIGYGFAAVSPWQLCREGLAFLPTFPPFCF